MFETFFYSTIFICAMVIIYNDIAQLAGAVEYTNCFSAEG